MKYLIALIVLLLPTYLIRFSIGGVPTTFLELLIYTIFIYGLFSVGYSHMLNLKKSVWFPIGLLLLAIVTSTIISPVKDVALGQLKAYFIDPILVFWLIICFLKKEDLKWLAYGGIGSATFVSIYSIIEKILGHIATDNRVVGIFGYSPNYVALFLVPFIVLFVAILNSLISKKKYLPAIIIGIITIINVYALYLSGSRGGELATIFGVIFYLICYFWKNISSRVIYKIILAIFIIITIVGTAWIFKPNFQASSGRVITSNNIRYQIWQASIELGSKHPLFGVGLGNFQEAFGEFTKDRGNFPEYITPEALTPHNVFLMFWLTTGFVGLLSFLWLLYIFYISGFRNFTKPPSKIILAMMSAIIFHGLVDAAYFANSLSILFWLVFASMIVIKTDDE